MTWLPDLDYGWWNAALQMGVLAAIGVYAIVRYVIPEIWRSWRDRRGR